MIKLFRGLPRTSKDKTFTKGNYNGHLFKNGSSYRTCAFDHCDFRGATSRFYTAPEALPTPVSFVGSKLSQCDFRGVDINQAILAGGRVENCDFSGSHLAQSMFHHAYVKGVRFAGAVLCGCDFTEASLAFVDFRACDLTESQWVNAKIYTDRPMGEYQFTNFQNARLSKSLFLGAKLAGIDFRHCEAYGCDFTDTDLRNADFRGARLNDVKFVNANLEGADFRGAFMDGCDMTGVNLDSFNFPRSFYDIVDGRLRTRKYGKEG